MPGAVRDVILTHMHYDHVGNFHKFPNARFHLQEREMAYATGKYMRYPRIGHSFHVEDVVGMVRLNFKGRVEMHEGEVEIAPGITLHPTCGHSDGLQSVRVHTRRGWVVLASDATHFYENMVTNRPFTTAFHIGQMLDAYRTLERLAPTPAPHRSGPRPLRDEGVSGAQAGARGHRRAPRRRAHRARAHVSGRRGTLRKGHGVIPAPRMPPGMSGDRPGSRHVEDNQGQVDWVPAFLSARAIARSRRRD